LNIQAKIFYLAMSPSPGGVGVNKKPPYTIAGWYSMGKFCFAYGKVDNFSCLLFQVNASQ